MIRLAVLLILTVGLAACDRPAEVPIQTDPSIWTDGHRLPLGLDHEGPTIGRPLSGELGLAFTDLASGNFEGAKLRLEPLAVNSDAGDPTARDAVRMLSALYTFLEEFSALNSLMEKNPWLFEEHWIHDVRRVFAEALTSARPGSLSFSGEATPIPTRQRRFKAPQFSVELGGPEGEEQAWLWLDTTAELTAIGSKLAEELGVIPIGETGSELRLDGGRRIPARPGILPLLRFGQLEVRNLPIAILDSDAISFKVAGVTLFQIDGLLGGPLLRHLRISVDYAGEESFVEPTHGPGNLSPELIWLGAPLARVENPEGDSLWFQLATAADRSLLHPARALEMKVPLGDERVESFPVRVGGGDVELRHISIEPWTSFTVLAGEDGRLSSGTLEKGILLVDIQAGQFIWSPSVR